MPKKFVAMPTTFSSQGDDEFPALHTTPQYYQPENVLEVEVRNPRTHGTSRSMYTDYEIAVHSNLPLFKRESVVLRRFSDFVAFRELLERELPHVFLASLPPKVFRNRFSDEVISERTAKLGQFIQQVSSHPLVQTGAAKLLTSFIQDDHWDAEAWFCE